MDTLKECNDIFGGFVIGKAIDSLIIGVLCFIVMTILRLPYTLLISLIVGITNMIPYFGPFIGAVSDCYADGQSAESGDLHYYDLRASAV